MNCARSEITAPRPTALSAQAVLPAGDLAGEPGGSRHRGTNSSFSLLSILCEHCTEKKTIAYFYVETHMSREEKKIHKNI